MVSACQSWLACCMLKASRRRFSPGSSLSNSYSRTKAAERGQRDLAGVQQSPFRCRTDRRLILSASSCGLFFAETKCGSAALIGFEDFFGRDLGVACLCRLAVKRPCR